ncbi:hypothetical protein [Antarctobacter sp.]|uniref:hypothetical protein n=1 Tax=Antarctobacter sp. TaxID=1872577 RepID=UPI002B26F489|nr:hypothetical protein [Antarctobacter sp.]
MQHAVDSAWQEIDGPVPDSHQACTACCMTPENDSRFFRVPRRTMPVTMLDDWFHAAFGGPASPDLRRYLLPRVFELLAQGTELGLSVELTLERFETGRADLWTDRENAVIAAFEAALIDAQTGVPSPWGCLDDIFCMFARAGHDMTRILDRVWGWPDGALVTRLHADWCHRGGGIWLWHTAFWDSDRPGLAKASAQVTDWYRGPLLQERCFDICLDETQSEAIQAMAGQLYDGLLHV